MNEKSETNVHDESWDFSYGKKSRINDVRIMKVVTDERISQYTKVGGDDVHVRFKYLIKKIIVVLCYVHLFATLWTYWTIPRTRILIAFLD